jgi:hypothetical protein
VIGSLRTLGVLNAAIWFGSAAGMLFCGSPALHSAAMLTLLEPKHYPYFSDAITQIMLTRWFHWQIVFGVIALIHFFGERLYFGQTAIKFPPGLLMALLGIMLLDGTLIQSRCQRYLPKQFAVNASAEDRDRSAAAFHAWDTAGGFAHLTLTIGLGFYVLRLGQSFDRRNT